MKLLFCKKCGSVFALRKEAKFCECGESGGKYLEDGLNAEFGGKAAVMLGINNFSFVKALRRQGAGSKQNVFEAWVMLDETDIPTIHRTEKFGG